jgi:hypothetical protein
MRPHTVLANVVAVARLPLPEYDRGEDGHRAENEMRAVEVRIGDQACEVTGRIVRAERLGDDSAPAELGVEFVGAGDARFRLVRELISEELV